MNRPLVVPSPAEVEVDAVLQARAVHGLIKNDPRMPPELRMLLVLYAGDLLERAGRSVELTPLGLAALAAAEETGPQASVPDPAPSGGTRRSRTSRPPHQASNAAGLTTKSSPSSRSALRKPAAASSAAARCRPAPRRSSSPSPARSLARTRATTSATGSATRAGPPIPPARASR